MNAGPQQVDGFALGRPERYVRAGVEHKGELPRYITHGRSKPGGKGRTYLYPDESLNQKPLRSKRCLLTLGMNHPQNGPQGNGRLRLGDLVGKNRYRPSSGARLKSVANSCSMPPAST